MNTTRKNSSRRLSWAALGIVSLALLTLAALLSRRPPAQEASVGIAPITSVGTAPITVASVVISSYGAPVLGVVVDRNLRVVGLDAGGAAEQAGIRKGDTITKVNAAPVASSSDGKRIVRQATGGQALALTLTRDGQELTISVLPGNREGGPGQPTPTPVPSDLDYF